MNVNKLISVTVITSIILVIWQLTVGAISVSFQWIFFAILLFAVGIPHGALDLYVQQKTDGLEGKPFSIWNFLTRYVLLIVLYLIIWYVFPLIAFLFFLFISCLHFGETDIVYLGSAAGNKGWLAFVYGVVLLTVLLLPHMKEVTTALLQLLPQYHILPLLLQYMQQDALLIFVIAITLWLAVILYLYANNKKIFKTGVMVQLLLLLLCCSKLPLLPAFALYFVGWHSLISLSQIDMYIERGNTSSTHQNFVLPLLKKGFPFSMLALAGLALAALYIHYSAMLIHPLPLLLVFLSLITLPHLQVMNGLYKKLNFQKHT